MAKQLSWSTVRRVMREKHLALFGSEEVVRLFRVSVSAARFFIYRARVRGDLLKLRRGLYAFSDQPPHDFLVANRMYAPSYVSYETALAYHRLIPETVYSITSATTKSTREFVAGEKTFLYHHLPRAKFTGYRPVAIEGFTALVADPEKALVDYLRLEALGFKPRLERLRREKVRWSAARWYLKLEPPRLQRLLQAYAKR